MAASVNLPPAPPLPSRPDPRLVQVCLDWRNGPFCGHETSKTLADELLHLRKLLEEKGSELGSLAFQAGEVVRAWQELSAPVHGSPVIEKLAAELDELAELIGAA